MLFFSKNSKTDPKSSKPSLQKRTQPVDPQLVDNDMEIIEAFSRVYCQHKHKEYKDGILCQECRELVEYARNRRENCPYDPKPKCKECPTHCYKPKFRERMKAIMRYSGMHFIKRGRIDWLIKYFWRS